MKIFSRKPLQSLIHIQFLRSSGRALHGLIGQLCSKCTTQDDGPTSSSETTSSNCKCLYKFFTPSSKGGTANVENVPGDDGNSEALTIQLKENGLTSNNILDNADKSILALDSRKKLSAHQRLRVWISSGHGGIIGRHGKKLELGAADVPKQFPSEHVNTVWPDWLMNVAPEAVQGWLPRRAESFEKLSKTGMFKPSLRYRRCIADNFKDFPQSALVILENLLALEPEARGTAASTLQSDFFSTKPFACSPSSLPKCPPSKEYDARLRQEEARRQRRAEGSKSVRPGKENPRINRATNGSIQPKKHAYISPKCNSANLNPEDDPLTLATRVQSPGLYSTWNNQGDCTGGRDVPGRKYNSVRVANSTVLMTRSSDLLQPESTEVRTNTHASHKNDLGRKGLVGNCRIKKRRKQYSGSLITLEGNIGEMLKEHERNIQEAVRKACIHNKSRES
ncbi:hypothetical protein ABZP36_009780 [Zizania latifolia]